MRYPLFILPFLILPLSTLAAPIPSQRSHDDPLSLHYRNVAGALGRAEEAALPFQHLNRRGVVIPTAADLTVNSGSFTLDTSLDALNGIKRPPPEGIKMPAPKRPDTGDHPLKPIHIPEEPSSPLYIPTEEEIRAAMDFKNPVPDSFPTDDEIRAAFASAEAKGFAPDSPPRTPDSPPLTPDPSSPPIVFPTDREIAALHPQDPKEAASSPPVVPSARLAELRYWLDRTLPYIAKDGDAPPRVPIQLDSPGSDFPGFPTSMEIDSLHPSSPGFGTPPPERMEID